MDKDTKTFLVFTGVGVGIIFFFMIVIELISTHTITVAGVTITAKGWQIALVCVVIGLGVLEYLGLLGRSRR